MRGGLTIGHAAAFAGITVKTARHYHRLGLVEEPERDRSGYRRYGSTDLLRLVQARTLVDLGQRASSVDVSASNPTAIRAAYTSPQRQQEAVSIAQRQPVTNSRSRHAAVSICRGPLFSLAGAAG